MTTNQNESPRKTVPACGSQCPPQPPGILHRPSAGCEGPAKAAAAVVAVRRQGGLRWENWTMYWACSGLLLIPKRSGHQQVRGLGSSTGSLSPRPVRSPARRRTWTLARSQSWRSWWTGTALRGSLWNCRSPLIRRRCRCCLPARRIASSRPGAWDRGDVRSRGASVGRAGHWKAGNPPQQRALHESGQAAGSGQSGWAGLARLRGRAVLLGGTFRAGELDGVWQLSSEFPWKGQRHDHAAHTG
ncbi:hypothetical protein ABIB27_001552 [Arthrobacter sp. UYEF21]